MDFALTPHDNNGEISFWNAVTYLITVSAQRRDPNRRPGPPEEVSVLDNCICSDVHYTARQSHLWPQCSCAFPQVAHKARISDLGPGDQQFQNTKQKQSWVSSDQQLNLFHKTHVVSKRKPGTMPAPLSRLLGTDRLKLKSKESTAARPSVCNYRYLNGGFCRSAALQLLSV